MHALIEQFPKTPVVGCEFHWKQARERRNGYQRKLWRKFMNIQTFNL
jgi:hypothetical protein